MGLFDKLKAALSAADPSSAELETALAEAARTVEKSRAEVDRLQAERADMLTAGDAERTSHKRALAAAQDRLEDADLYLLRLSGRLKDTQAAEEAARRRSDYDAAKRLSTAAAKRLEAEYPKLCHALLDLMRACTEAACAVEQANNDLPEGLPVLLDPEALVRDQRALPAEVIREEVVERWCVGDTCITWDHFVAEGLVGQRTAVIEHQGRFVELRLRKFKLTETKAYVPGHRGSRLHDLHLPGLRWSDPNLWTKTPMHRTAAEVLSEVEQKEAQRAQPISKQLRAREQHLTPIDGVDRDWEI